AFHRVGDVTETIEGLGGLMGMVFNAAPPGALVDTTGGAAAAVAMIEKAGVPVPELLEKAAKSGEPKRFFENPRINVGRFFVAG
ncbi:MAG: hypothetical protein GY946_23570, partial [bacterium]|nr:hypothetical protein [bacterium]